MSLRRAALFLPTLACSVLAAPGYSSFDNVWLSIDSLLAGNFASVTEYAQETIIVWADMLAAGGPWSVMNKTVTPPSGDKHDYMSWAPYSWPNCTGVGNTTELTPEEIWVECPYYTRDGVFNPDYTLADDSTHFSNLSDAVLYNALAWNLNKSNTKYASNVASWIDTWFLNEESYMSPNLNYAQMSRGPNGQNGTHTGVLDLKCMAKVVSGIRLLRQGASPAWTNELDTAMANWTTHYIDWLTTADIALQEAAADNNHGSFYFNQLASLQILINDTASALKTVQTYFNTTYQTQINSTGEQPYEAVRTRPYHYRVYNIAAMVTNARIAQDLGWNAWNYTTKYGATIKTALDFTMGVNPDGELPTEIDIDVADVAAAYGDPSGTYATFMNASYPLYPEMPYFLWDQPLSNSNFVANSTDGPDGPEPSTVSTSHSSTATRFSAVSTLSIALIGFIETTFALL